jgi:hypothetical protein
VCYERKIFENWNFENRDFWKFSTHSFRFLHSKLRFSDVKKFNQLISLRSDSSLAERSREASGHLVKKGDLSSEIMYQVNLSIRSYVIHDLRGIEWGYKFKLIFLQKMSSDRDINFKTYSEPVLKVRHAIRCHLYELT